MGTPNRSPNESERARFDVEALVPQKPFIRVTEFAKDWLVSTHHVVNLIRSGEIVVPKELQESAPSLAAMRIPRANVVDFLKRRSNLRAVAARARKFKYNPKSKRVAAANTRPLTRAERLQRRKGKR